MLADGTMLAVWKNLIEPASHKGSLSQEQMLHNLQALHKAPGRWVVILSQGGHFAAAVFDCLPLKDSQQSKRDIPTFTAVEHKTFHRYVVRYSISSGTAVCQAWSRARCCLRYPSICFLITACLSCSLCARCPYCNLSSRCVTMCSHSCYEASEVHMAACMKTINSWQRMCACWTSCFMRSDQYGIMRFLPAQG